MNSSVRKAGHWENNCEGMVIRGYTAPLINMLADLLSSYIYFQEQNTMKTLGILVLK